MNKSSASFCCIAVNWIENRFDVFGASIMLPRLGNMYHEPLECVWSLSGPSKQVRRVELRVFSSITPSSLALPPEMAFQRATGGMPVHITVHRRLSNLLTYMQQPFTRHGILPLVHSLSPYIAEWLSADTARTPTPVTVLWSNCLEIDKLFLKSTSEVLHMLISSYDSAFHL